MNTEQLTPGTGIFVQTLQVAEALSRRGHEVDLLFMKDGPYRASFASFCHSMRKVPALDLGVTRVLREAPLLVPAIVAGAWRRPDVVYVNRFRPLPWAVATGALSGAPVVCHVHGLIGIDHPSVNRVLGRRTAKFIAISQFVRDRFVGWGADPDKVDVVHNGIDPAAYPAGGLPERRAARAGLGILPERPLVLYFGRVDPTKGVDVLFDAVAGLQDPDAVEVLVVGPIGDDDYGRRLRRHPVGARAHWLPMRVDVVTPLHAADVVVAPSTWEEPFGRTVIEGLSTGRPVIASDVGGVPEILDGPFERFLVPGGDVPALTRALAGILDWRDREPGLAVACTRHVAGRFTLEQCVDGVEQRLVDAVGSS